MYFDYIDRSDNIFLNLLCFRFTFSFTFPNKFPIIINDIRNYSMIFDKLYKLS